MGKKQKNYEGSIYTRKGSPYYWIEYQGKCFSSKVRIGETKAEDKEQRNMLISWLKDKSAQKRLEQRGVLEHTEKAGIKTLWEQYLKKSEKLLLENTLRSYKLAYRQIVDNENIEFSKKNIENMAEAFVVKKRDVLSAASINIYLRSFQVFVSWAANKVGISHFNIYQPYRRKVRKKEVLPYSQDEFNAIAEVFLKGRQTEQTTIKPDMQFYLLLQFLRYTGGRIKETLSLRWQDVDYESGVICYRKKTQTDNYDVLPLTTNIKETLSKIKLLNKNTDGKIFTWETSSMSRLVRRLSNAEDILGIKIKGRAFHGIRKMFATELLNKGIDPYQVKNLMRHEDINTTIKMYSRENLHIMQQILEDNVH